jgi:hypothetical protein
MTAMPAPPDLDVLMERLRAEVAARRKQALAPPAEEPDDTEAAEAIDPARRRYHVREFLYLPDAAFVRAAARAVLGRDPTATEQADLLDRLRLGQAERLEIVAILRQQPEGQARGAGIGGLQARLFVMRVRRSASLAALRSMVRLLRNTPRLAGYMRQVVARVDQAERKADSATQRAAEATQALIAAEARLDAAEAALRQITARLEAAEQALGGVAPPADRPGAPARERAGSA